MAAMPNATVAKRDGTGAFTRRFRTHSLNGVRLILVVALAEFLSAATVSAPVIAQAAAPPSNGPRTRVEVPATQPWTDTRIDVTAGTRVSIEAFGTIRIAGSDPGKSPAAETPGSPDSNATQCSADNTATILWVAPGLYCWSMIGKIGQDGKPFEVDYGLTVNPPSSGRLFLGVNDDQNTFGDNSGSWTAEVWATFDNCPKRFFIGVRGSGETNDTGGGYGVPIAAHRYYLQKAFGDGIEPLFIDYPAVKVSNIWEAIQATTTYKPSVADGESKLEDQIVSDSVGCPQASIALAGYSQGAHVISNCLEPDPNSASLAGSCQVFKASIKDVTLYGNPRHSSKVLSFERWVDVSSNPGQFSPSLYQGVSVVLGWKQFMVNPVGDALRSYCDLTFDKPDGTPTLDPVCGTPTDLDVAHATVNAYSSYKGRHDRYDLVVPIAVKDSTAHMR